MTEPKPRNPASSTTDRATSTTANGSKLRGFFVSALAWDAFLALMTLVPALVFTTLFFPGRANVDIGNQYAQATGDIPFSDWHPPVMSAVWRVLISITGEAGSLFVPKTWPLWIPALGLLVYAFGLRKNAIFAIVPIAVYIGYLLVKRLRSSRRFSTIAGRFGTRVGARFAARQVIATAMASLLVLVVLGAGLKATDAAIESQEDVAATGRVSQIFLDDVMFSVPNGALQASEAPAELKNKISTARDKCLEKGEIWDAYWSCYGKGATGEPFSPMAQQEALKDLWLSEVITHPLRYAEYRAAVFSFYFFTSAVEYWRAGWHHAAARVGFEQGNDKADYIVKPYVEDFALDTFPMLFKPWFWTLLAGVLLAFGYRARHRDTSAAERTATARTFWPEITMLATSALFYVFGYLPIVPSNHFRYTFWPALAVTTALLFVLAMRHTQRAPTAMDVSEPGP
ncbi:hypothetical protein [Brevibacterium aurantiacum]|uniref:Uncharacterized protein n=1 Tax=Brevibacterium aurantiacum TaxID=273384 RepID=A0A1D7W6S6_BREAU|nr:hypothetical protein [Brevibacterium aurantiacum]AOP54749.1 hypothetical protein BLSMQ_3047 [Brevibacterium aurantiacum]RCT00182.1 hypothetical protein CIK60_01205 [Brevibacterium aurantiacum]